MEEKRRCPYCGEEIMATAKKCRHCGEWLDKEAAPQKKAAAATQPQQPTKTTQNEPKAAPRADQAAGNVPASPKNGSLFQYWTYCWKNIANYSGRARRKEYWSYLAVLVGIAFLFAICLALVGESSAINGFLTMVMGIFFFASIIPYLALRARRLHDINHSAWFLLILFPSIDLIFGLIEGTHGPNKYGPDPKA